MVIDGTTTEHVMGEMFGGRATLEAFERQRDRDRILGIPDDMTELTMAFLWMRIGTIEQFVREHDADPSRHLLIPWEKTWDGIYATERFILAPKGQHLFGTFEESAKLYPSLVLNWKTLLGR